MKRRGRVDLVVPLPAFARTSRMPAVPRLAGLAAAVALLLAAAPAAGQGACTVHPPAPPIGLGEAILLDFGPDSTVTKVFAQIQEGLLRPWVVGALALDITITSLDGIDHFHGTDVIALSEATVADVEDGVATMQIAWTEDQEPQVVGDVYTVCVQLVAGTPVSPERCRTFGPFF